MTRIRVGTLVVALLLVGGGLFLLATDTAYAEAVGCRTTSNPAQMVGTDGWDSGFSVCWNVSQVGPNWVYNYTVTAPVGTRDISHLIVELTKDVTVLVSSGNWTATHGTFNPGPGNPGMPASMYGVKLDFNDEPFSVNFTLTTPEAPVWGNFYAKDGVFQPGSVDVIAYNVGFGTPQPTSDALTAIENAFIVRPDGNGGTTEEVPEPSLLLLASVGLAGVVGSRFVVPRPRACA